MRHALWLLALLSACGAPIIECVDGGCAADAADAADAGQVGFNTGRDAGLVDAGVPDAGPFDAGGSGIDAGPCLDQCAPGAESCSGGLLRVCGVGAAGCRQWSEPTSCPGGFCQTGAACGACVHACAPGATSCVGGQLRTCVADVNGCRAWGPERACPGGFCSSASSCGTCVHQCAPGERQCSGQQLRTCTTDANGCRVWSAASTCAEGFCADSTSCGTCAHGCPVAGQSQCSAGQLQTCVADAHGCRAWSAAMSCASGFCGSATSCGNCTNSCATSGATECTAGALRTCTADANGCRAWSPSTPCASGFCAGAVCGACTHECAAGATSCANGQLRACVADARGCRAWGPASACATNVCASTTECDVDECALGTAACPANSRCVNTPGAYRCDCDCGWVAAGSVCVDQYPNTHLVDGRALDGGTGQCWPKAFRDLQDALAVARPGDEVWVARGTYRPGNATASTYHLVPGVSLYGGFVGNETARTQRNAATNVTRLSAVMSPQHIQRLITVLPGAEPTVVDGFTLEGARALSQGNDFGGAVQVNASSPVFRNVVFQNNQATFGGTMGVLGGHPELDHCTVSTSGGVTVRAVGGAGGVTLRNCTFTGGQALELESGTSALVEDSTFDTDGWAGGAIKANDAGVTVRRSIFTNCRADVGGAIYSIRGELVVADSSFTSNTANQSGGAIFKYEGALQVERCTFTGNQASNTSVEGKGGALYGQRVTGWVRSSTFAGNVAGTSGGGAWLSPTSDFPLSGAFLRNSASYNGGGAYVSQGGTSTLAVDDSSFAANDAGLSGGGLFVSGNLRLSRSTFQGNSGRWGGGLSASGVATNRVEAMNVSFTDNTALAAGGGAHVYPPQSWFNASFVGNRSVSDGSALETFDGQVVVGNVSFANNSGGRAAATFTDWAATANVTVKNAVFWGNTPAGYANTASSFSMSSSSLQEPAAGPGNVVLMASPFDANLRLLPGSSCIDTGDVSAVPVDLFDLDGDGDRSEPVPIDARGWPRVVRTIDRGAFEAP